VLARIERVDPHLALRDASWEPVDVAGDEADGSSSVELFDRRRVDPLAERWDRLCEAWRQTTFFLFDPDSWR
jgi:hypothetical protein